MRGPIVHVAFSLGFGVCALVAIVKGELELGLLALICSYLHEVLGELKEQRP